ncbi:hypothetical protein [Magnetococcus sp. PR-3]|uniref:hypothetical protein n=1 Tax=Magnetococcus sp. PR-3 TaxID=3120355 RepID=UPI002FCE3A2F
MRDNPYQATTGTGLDALIKIITSDERLNQRIEAEDIDAGAAAADAMNALIIEAIQATGVAQNGRISTADVRQINQWLQEDQSRQDQWTEWHGDDEGEEETGFHLEQNDGANTQLYGRNAVNTVADGLYHLGFDVEGGRLLNEDGNKNARLSDVANWLDDLLADDLATDTASSLLIHSEVPSPYFNATTDSGLDQLIDIINGDNRLEQRISTEEIHDGAAAADGMNSILLESIRATGVAYDGDLNAADIRAMNHWIRDENHTDAEGTSYLERWTQLHGDDEESGEETGFHLVQNDGANSQLFGRNAVNSVADGIYHLGFEIEGNNLLNEDGNRNVRLDRVADWLEELLKDDLLEATNNASESILIDTTVNDPTFQATTGTGLDQLVEIINNDARLNQKVSTLDIEEGAAAADAMNSMIIDAVKGTGVAVDGDINIADVRDINHWLRDENNTIDGETTYLEAWTTQHGDDEGDAETGFHLVQNDGANSRLFGRNAVNNVADGLYHLGFEIEKGRLLNEDGDRNASLSQVSDWLNELLKEELSANQEESLLVDKNTDTPYFEATTETGLDQLVEIITSDERLNQKISTSDISEGAAAADAMNSMIIDAIRATGTAYDGTLNVADMRDINHWLRDENNTIDGETTYLEAWTTQHGDDEGDEETGFHLVQNDGANSSLFGRNAVNTVADGLYHLGFEVERYNVLNEDGDRNASLFSLSNWMEELLGEDLAQALDAPKESLLIDGSVENPYTTGTTDTGLDQLVEIITSDSRLNYKISTTEIQDGAAAADGLNHILLDAIQETQTATDGSFDQEDMQAINAWIRDAENQDATTGETILEQWVSLHGDDEGTGEETGFHLVQNDGAHSRLFGRNAVNTVADGIYHMGFEIERGRLLNEDGNRNASLDSVASWLNELLEEDLNNSESALYDVDNLLN